MLDNLTSTHFEENWEPFHKTFMQTVKFLADLRICGPDMLPYVYLALPLCYYFHGNNQPNRDIARQWFWRSAFGPDALTSSTNIYGACENYFAPLERGEGVSLQPLAVSRTRLVQASYNYRNALSRAVLGFLANQNPLDFGDPRAVVLDQVYLLLSQAPNLHHIYPRNFLVQVKDLPKDVSADSLMNICFIRAATNIRIGDKNPLEYFRDIEARPVRDFDRILESHLIPRKFIERDVFTPEDYRAFLFARAQWYADRLAAELPDVEVTIAD